MAQVKYGTIVTEMKGKIGGNVFQGGGPAPTCKKLWGYIRKGKRLKKLWGYIKRSAIASQSQAWKGLTDAQRAQWNAAAPNFPAYNRFGDPYTPSGYQLWCTVQVRQTITGRAVLTDAPTPVTFPILLAASAVVINPELVRITISPGLAAGWMLQVEATAGFSAGASMYKGGYSLIGYYTPAGGTVVDCTTNYVLQLGAPIVGSKVFIRVRPVSPGGLVNNVWYLFSETVVAV